MFMYDQTKRSNCQIKTLTHLRSLDDIEILWFIAYQNLIYVQCTRKNGQEKMSTIHQVQTLQGKNLH